jgi:hypothetical protein
VRVLQVLQLVVLVLVLVRSASAATIAAITAITICFLSSRKHKLRISVWISLLSSLIVRFCFFSTKKPKIGKGSLPKIGAILNKTNNQPMSHSSLRINYTLHFCPTSARVRLFTCRMCNCPGQCLPDKIMTVLENSLVVLTSLAVNKKHRYVLN